MRNTLLTLLARLLRLTRPNTPAAHTVLILQYQMPLGCCVHNTPLYTALKQAFPEAKVIVATRGLGLATLQHDPHIDHLLHTADPTTSILAALRVARQLRRQLRQQNLHPDIILQDASSRAGSFALFAALLRLAPTAGFANAPALYDTHLPYDPTLSIIDNNLRLLTVLGATPHHVEPAVYFTAADLAHAHALLADDARPTTAVIVHGSGGQPTAWHDDRFAAVIRHAAARGHRILYLGTAAEAPAIDRIRSLTGNLGTSLAGRTTVPQLAALLCLCDLAISIDTGSLHVARATGLPLVILHPCWQDPLDWLPIHAPNARILRGPRTPTIPPTTASTTSPPPPPSPPSTTSSPSAPIPRSPRRPHPPPPLHNTRRYTAVILSAAKNPCILLEPPQMRPRTGAPFMTVSSSWVGEAPKPSDKTSTAPPTHPATYKTPETTHSPPPPHESPSPPRP